MKNQFTLLISFLFLVIFAGAQPVNYIEAPVFDNSTSTGRGPNGTTNHVYMRACGLVKATELSGIASNATISSFGFSLNAGASTNAPTGNFTLYLQNTSDITYNKGTSFSTAIGGMSQVYASTMTIPLSSGATSVVINLSTPFVYTGGGIYVAYDWYNPGPYSSSAAVYRCNSGGLSPGLASNASGTSVGDLLGTTAFRPTFLWGVANTYTNEIGVLSMDAPGRLAGGLFSTSHTVTATVRNNSNITKNNVVVSLNVAGANTFAASHTIASLASGASSLVSFSAFTPTAAGMNTLTVSVPADELNTNNSNVWTQSITCNEWGLNPAGVSYTAGAVGFNTGSGILGVSYFSPATATLTGIRGGISTNTPAIGNGCWAVLLSSTGSIIATTNTVTITSGLLGSSVDYTFATPPVLAGSTNYYLGFAQPTGTAGYFPAGTYTSAYVPIQNYITTTTLGATPAPLTSNLGYFKIEALFAPTLNIAVSPQTVTCGNSAILSATTSAANYTWAGGPSNTSYTVAPISNTIYTVQAINAFACQASRTVAVAVNPLPVTVASSTSAICAGETVSLSASGAPTFTWNTGPALNSSSFTDSPVSSVVYSVQGSNSAGCFASASVAVQVNAIPVIGLSPSTVVCGSAATLVANTSDSYTWTAGPSNSNHVVTPTINTVYTVVATSTAGCSGSNTVAVSVDPLSINATSSSSAICAGESVSISVTGASTYTWSSGPSVNAATFVDSPAVTTTYSVQAEGLPGCAASDVVVVTVNTFSNLGVTGNFSLCGSGVFTATATGGSTYTWTGANGSYTTASLTQTLFLPTVYTLQGTDQNGCSASTTVAVNVLQIPVLTVLYSPSNSVCVGQTATITALGADSYSWSTGATTSTIAVTGTAVGNYVYTVTLTNGGFCSDVAVVGFKVDECVGIVESAASEAIQVYPNPVSDRFFVKLSGQHVYTMKLYNSAGQLVRQQIVESNEPLEIDVQELPSGLYHLAMENDGALTKRIKVIKD